MGSTTCGGRGKGVKTNLTQFVSVTTEAVSCFIILMAFLQMPSSRLQPSYARAAQQGLSMAIIRDGYPKVQVSKEDFEKIQWAIGGLVDGLPEEGFTPKLIDTYWATGAATVVCRDEETKDWLGSAQDECVGGLKAQDGGPRGSSPLIREWRLGFQAPWRIQSICFIGSID
jgi:hypothetical protein